MGRDYVSAVYLKIINNFSLKSYQGGIEWWYGGETKYIKWSYNIHIKHYYIYIAKSKTVNIFKILYKYKECLTQHDSYLDFAYIVAYWVLSSKYTVQFCHPPLSAPSNLFCQLKITIYLILTQHYKQPSSIIQWSLKMKTIHSTQVQYLAHSKYSINIYWVEKMKIPLLFPNENILCQDYYSKNLFIIPRIYLTTTNSHKVLS